MFSAGDVTPWIALIALLLAFVWAVWRMIEPLTRISESLEALVEILRGDASGADRPRAAARPGAGARPQDDRVEWSGARSSAGLGPKA
jgi:hypothetical protein